MPALSYFLPYHNGLSSGSGSLNSSVRIIILHQLLSGVQQSAVLLPVVVVVVVVIQSILTSSSTTSDSQRPSYQTAGDGGRRRRRRRPRVEVKIPKHLILLEKRKEKILGYFYCFISERTEQTNYNFPAQTKSQLANPCHSNLSLFLSLHGLIAVDKEIIGDHHPEWISRMTTGKQ